MVAIRKPAVAGYFYPHHSEELAATVRGFLPVSARESRRPKSVIVPHAGYFYSGRVAGAAYSVLENRPAPGTILIVGPAHRRPVRGIALSSAEFFQTPLGRVPVNHKVRDRIMTLPGAVISDEAHREEHCIEVQLPFLQNIYGDFTIVPVLTGSDSGVVVRMLEMVADDADLIVISSDLSHYLPYDEAVRLDESTSESILSFSQENIGIDQACGHAAICGFLQFAGAGNFAAKRLMAANSGDITGDRSRVVGYGSFLFTC